MRLPLRLSSLALLLACLVAAPACRSPRLGGAGDTCGRTDDCAEPLRCLEGACRTSLPASTRPVLTRAPLPELAPALATRVAPEPATLPAATPLPTGLKPGALGVPDESTAPAAGVPGQH